MNILLHSYFDAKPQNRQKPQTLKDVVRKLFIVRIFEVKNILSGNNGWRGGLFIIIETVDECKFPKPRRMRKVNFL